jgi:hypothetical protein
VASQLLRGLVLGVAGAGLVVAVVALTVAGFGVPEPQRSKIVVLTVVIVIPFLFVWVAVAMGKAKAAGLAEFSLPGVGDEVLVLRVRLPDRRWVSGKWRRPPAPARLLLRSDDLVLTWHNGEMSTWLWTGARSISRRLVWSGHLRADAVTISAGEFHVEYVPFDGQRPLRGTPFTEYVDSVRRLVLGDRRP